MILLDQAGAGADRARFFPPLRTQVPFIEHFWIQETDPTPVRRDWRIIPDLNPYLIFAISRKDSRAHARCVLVGPRSRFADVTMADRLLTCGARLRPGALPSLTRLPASDFTDRSVCVEDVFGARGRVLIERLDGLRCPNRAIRVISGFLSREWSRNDRRIDHLPLDEFTRVEDMAARTGLSIRTLRSRLASHVGLSPKRVIRIERLYRALVNAQRRAVAWGEIAASSGFADQAHMIRDFHDLLGESPTEWSRRSRLPIRSRQ
ncbi:MAG TPA: helix-turn-helix transcriptional regulator [Candidatus Acidoferrales bacterium]|nr:helix-turn-helix transcriptional regulator [Candidatus Acidoferrales bacterium]